MLYYFFFSFSISQIEFSFLTFCKTVIMGKNEYDAIRGYLLTNVIPPEIKSDRNKKEEFCQDVQGDLLPR